MNYGLEVTYQMPRYSLLDFLHKKIGIRGDVVILLSEWIDAGEVAELGIQLTGIEVEQVESVCAVKFLTAILVILCARIRADVCHQVPRIIR